MVRAKSKTDDIRYTEAGIPLNEYGVPIAPDTRPETHDPEQAGQLRWRQLEATALRESTGKDPAADRVRTLSDQRKSLPDLQAAAFDRAQQQYRQQRANIVQHYQTEQLRIRQELAAAVTAALDPDGEPTARHSHQSLAKAVGQDRDWVRYQVKQHYAFTHPNKKSPPLSDVHLSLPVSNTLQDLLADDDLEL